MNAIIDLYNQLSERDKMMAQIGAPLLLLLIIIFALVMPVNSAVSGVNKKVESNKQAIVLLQSMSPQSSEGNKKGFKNLTQVITSTTRQFNFRLERFEEKKNGEINVWFDQINFDQMLNWLARLENDYGITTSFISVSQTNELGIVRVNLRLITQ